MQEILPSVLIVEDDTVQRSDLVEMVVALGLRAATAGNGREALAMLESSPANVILTDLVMPGMDGFGLLRELAARGDATPAIVMTGFGSLDKAISVVHDLKAFWFLESPSSPEYYARLSSARSGTTVSWKKPSDSVASLAIREP